MSASHGGYEDYLITTITIMSTFVGHLLWAKYCTQWSPPP